MDFAIKSNMFSTYFALNYKQIEIDQWERATCNDDLLPLKNTDSLALPFILTTSSDSDQSPATFLSSVS
jgi:hypothetical protein